MNVIEYQWSTIEDMRVANRANNTQLLLQKVREKKQIIDRKKNWGHLDSLKHDHGVGKSIVDEPVTVAYKGSKVKFHRYRVDDELNRKQLLSQIKSLPIRFVAKSGLNKKPSLHFNRTETKSPSDFDLLTIVELDNSLK